MEGSYWNIAGFNGVGRRTNADNWHHQNGAFAIYAAVAITVTRWHLFDCMCCHHRDNCVQGVCRYLPGQQQRKLVLDHHVLAIGVVDDEVPHFSTGLAWRYWCCIEESYFLVCGRDGPGMPCNVIWMVSNVESWSQVTNIITITNMLDYYYFLFY